jgi:hypothetical protein
MLNITVFSSLAILINSLFIEVNNHKIIKESRFSNYIQNPDSLLNNSKKNNEFNMYVRKESIHPDSIILKKERRNNLPDSLKMRNEK